MIQAVSRFRVRNALEAEVRNAFLDRPHLVDQMPGYLGMEVFTDADDPAIFYLFTRWSDVDSFRHWHASDANRLSGRAIPRMIKLDPSFTQVLILNRLHDSLRPPNLTEITADAALLLARHLESTQLVHLVMAASDGRILGCNSAIAKSLKIPHDELVGRSFWNSLPDHDAAVLRRRVESAGPALADRFLMNVIDAENVPFTLECLLDVQPDGFRLLGEAPRKQDDAFQEEMLRLNNELAVLTRENVRKSLRIGAGPHRSERCASQTGASGEDGLARAIDRGDTHTRSITPSPLWVIIRLTFRTSRFDFPRISPGANRR